MNYSENLRKKIYGELMADKGFVEFAKEEHEERASIRGVFCFKNEFEEDVYSNLEHYKDMWETHCLFNNIDLEDEKTQKLFGKALDDVLSIFN